MGYYIPLFYVDVIPYPCSYPDSGLPNLQYSQRPLRPPKVKLCINDDFIQTLWNVTNVARKYYLSLQYLINENYIEIERSIARENERGMEGDRESGEREREARRRTDVRRSRVSVNRNRLSNDSINFKKSARNIEKRDVN